MKRITITEQYLRGIIKDFVNNALKIQLNEETILYSSNENQQTIKLLNLDMNNVADKHYVKQHISEIWHLLETGYEKIGGFKGFQSPKDLLKKSPFLRIGYCDNDMVTIAVYNSYLGGNKCVGLSCIKDERHAIAVKLLEMILKYDITNWQEWVWIEASGKVEEMCKKLNAFNVPSEYAVIYLQNIPHKIRDAYHYIRKIGGREEQKTIFGFKDIESFEILKSDLNKQINSFLENIYQQPINEHTSKQKYIYQRYIQKKGKCQIYKDIIDYFLYLHEDELVNELPKESLLILENAIKTLDKMYKDNDLSIDKKIVEMTIENGKELLKKFTVLYPIAL